MKTSIIILTCNNLEYNKLCIDSIRNFTEKNNYEIIVVDNASTDGTVEWIKEQKDIKLILNELNLGFPKGCNQGIALATGDNILLLNNDVIVTKNWLENLMCCLYSSEDIGAVGPVTNNSSYNQTVASYYDNLEEMFAFAEKFNISDPDLWEQRVRLVGFCLLIKKAVIEKIGLLDEIFTPGNYEDDDYSYRIIQSGYKLMLCKDTYIHHFGSLTFNKQGEGFNSLLSNNERKFQEKWGFNSYNYSKIENGIVDLIREDKSKVLNILHLGCGCGATLLKIKHLFRNANLYGLESNTDAAQIAKHFANVENLDVKNAILNYENNFFDYIILSNLSIKNWSNILHVLKNFLKFNSKILGTFNNAMHYSLIKDLINGSNVFGNEKVSDENFYNYSTINDVKKIFYESGYKDVEVKGKFDAINKDDLEFINKLTEFTDDNFRSQYECKEYTIKAIRKESSFDSDNYQNKNNEKFESNEVKLINEKKICFICCVNNEELFKKALYYLKSLEIPQGYEIEVVRINNAEYMTKEYNKVMKVNDAKYKVYLHQDVFIINKKFIEDILNIFKQDPSVGMIGVAGAETIPNNGVWWESPLTFGKLYGNHNGDEMDIISFKEVEGDYQSVNCIDGLLMITQYDVKWREDIFKGWHFYDISQSTEFLEAGYKVVVPRQNDPWCIHDSGVPSLKGYEEYRKVFIKEYEKYLS